MPTRCKWVSDNLIDYHDNYWGRVNKDDHYLFEMLILEMFQAGLSWEIVYNKRVGFKKAFANFDVNAVAKFTNLDVAKLVNDPAIIKNQQKIVSAINNAKVFIAIQTEFGSFANYIWHFTNNTVINDEDNIKLNQSELSNIVAKDLKKRGMKFIGSITIHAYLQAIGVMNCHEKNCFLGK